MDLIPVSNGYTFNNIFVQGLLVGTIVINYGSASNGTQGKIASDMEGCYVGIIGNNIYAKSRVNMATVYLSNSYYSSIYGTTNAVSINLSNLSDNNWYYNNFNTSVATCSTNNTIYVQRYTNLQEFLNSSVTVLYPITYRDTNATHSGPDSASPGDVVSVDYTFADGYGIVNPSTDIYVTNNGVIVPSSYSNGTLTFTMPDPSE